jgi:hypothetical protein
MFSISAIALLFATFLFGADAKQTFTGKITDDMCIRDHSTMQMGPNDAECTKACVLAHGAQYILFDGKSAFNLSDQTAPEKFAGQMVKVVGTLDAKTKTIQVDSISATK